MTLKRAWNANITPGFQPAMCSFLNWGTGLLCPVALTYDPHNPARCQIVFALDETAKGGGTFTIWAAGAKAFEGKMNVPDTTTENGREYTPPQDGEPLELKAGIPPFPSRAEACSIQIHFQGSYVDSKTYGAVYQAQYGGPGQIPYFGAAFADFAIVDGTTGLLDQIQAWGDTHVMHFCGDNDTGYNENGQPYGVDQIVKPCNSWANMPFYIECADAIIARGLKPMYTLDGEGGPDWLKANFAAWVQAMRTGYDRLRYGPVTVAFDGVWPAAWTPQQMMDMIPWMRDVLGPDAYLGFWYGNGPSGNPYLWVNDESDYAQPWCDGLDIVLTTSGPDEALGVSMANKAQYMVKEPNFSEFQPTFHGPFVFHDNSRGPRYWGNVEFLTYQTVRDPNQVYKAPSETQRQQMRTMNVPCAG